MAPRSIWLAAFALPPILAGAASDPAGKRYLTEEFFRKQRDCESRKAPSRANIAKFDHGPTVHDSQRSVIWKQQSRYLGDSCFIAHIGPIVYADGNKDEFAAYSISVEIGLSDPGSPRPSSVVVYNRHFRMNELPAGIEGREVADVVLFDEGARTVRFNLGRSTHEYKLPAL